MAVQMSREALFGAAWCELVAELDWALLGRTYCEGDGSSFFDEALLEQVLDTGLDLVDGLAAALPRAGAARSVYVGAAVAELPLLLGEVLVMGREVHWLNLPGPEVVELRRGLQVVGAKLGVRLPQPETHNLTHVPDASCDHVWLASVLTDPDAFPALHDRLYERVGGALATGRGDAAADLARAEQLVREVLAKATRPALLSTTDEELELIVPIARTLGLQLSVPTTGTLSAIVGDTLRYVRVASKS